jgi:hypothetical protein
VVGWRFETLNFEFRADHARLGECHPPNSPLQDLCTDSRLSDRSCRVNAAALIAVNSGLTDGTAADNPNRQFALCLLARRTTSGYLTEPRVGRLPSI